MNPEQRVCPGCRAQHALVFDHIAGRVYWQCFHCWPKPFGGGRINA